MHDSPTPHADPAVAVPERECPPFGEYAPDDTTPIAVRLLDIPGGERAGVTDVPIVHGVALTSQVLGALRVFEEHVEPQFRARCRTLADLRADVARLEAIR